MASSGAMIEVEHLSKSYGGVRAVRNISFRVDPGDVVGFLGPNGAGKTTTLRVLAGFIGASSGRARVAGYDVADEPMLARRAIGYMPEAYPLYPELRVVEYLRFRAELKRVPRRRRRPEIGRVLALAGASEVSGVPIGQLSKGYRQRVGLADALLGSPPLLVLDEPTAGLDPNQIQQVRELLRSLAPPHTILLSTHILSEVEATCSRAIVIAQGRLVAEGALSDLRRQRRQGGRLELDVRGDGARAAEILRGLSAVGGVQVQAPSADGRAHRLVVTLAGAEPATTEGADPLAELAEQIAFALTEARFGLRRLAPVAPSLEQVFAELTGAQADAPSPARSSAASRATQEPS